MMMCGLLFSVFVFFFISQLGAIEDKDLGRGDAAAVDLFGSEGDPEVEGGDSVVQNLGGESGVEQSAEKHISADAGKAVEVSDAHGAIVSCVGRYGDARGAASGAGDLQDIRITLREGEKGIHFPAGSRTQSKHRLRCGALLP